MEELKYENSVPLERPIKIFELKKFSFEEVRENLKRNN